MGFVINQTLERIKTLKDNLQTYKENSTEKYYEMDKKVPLLEQKIDKSITVKL